jgi:hypothetical protein
MSITSRFNASISPIRVEMLINESLFGRLWQNICSFVRFWLDKTCDPKYANEPVLADLAADCN